MPSSTGCVVAIVITYNPDIELLQRQLTSLSEQQCPAVYVDNGSSPAVLEELRRLLDGHQLVILHALENNKGIAAAQNTGIRLSVDHYPDSRYFLTLDHDSIPRDGMVEKLVDCHRQMSSAEIKVGITGPLLFDPRVRSYLNLHVASGLLWKKVVPRPGGKALQVDGLNSSGSLISREALQAVGEFDESMFIDHVETEWCFRAIHRGYSVFVCQDAVMEHSMGDEMTVFKLGRDWHIPYRAPKRHYTIVRNSIYLQRRSYVPRVWKLWNGLKLIFTYLYFGFVSKDSTVQRRWIHKGITDGIHRRMGPVPEDNG